MILYIFIPRPPAEGNAFFSTLFSPSLIEKRYSFVRRFLPEEGMGD